MKLLSADVCRDGGSIAADFMLEDGSLLSLLLQVSHAMVRGERYNCLHVGSEIQNSYDPSTIVPKDSATDEDIRAKLLSWLAQVPEAQRQSQIDGSLRRSRSDEETSLHWAIELCLQMNHRDV